MLGGILGAVEGGRYLEKMAHTSAVLIGVSKVRLSCTCGTRPSAVPATGAVKFFQIKLNVFFGYFEPFFFFLDNKNK